MIKDIFKNMFDDFNKNQALIEELKKEQIYKELMEFKDSFNKQTGIPESKIKCLLCLDILDGTQGTQGAQVYKLDLINQERSFNVIRLVYTDHYHLFLLDNKVSYNMIMVSKSNVSKEIERMLHIKENSTFLQMTIQRMLYDRRWRNSDIEGIR